MFKYAKSGNKFVLTEYGYEKTPDSVKPEREIGKPVFHHYETFVPESWVEKGYVVEVKA